MPPSKATPTIRSTSPQRRDRRSFRAGPANDFEQRLLRRLNPIPTPERAADDKNRGHHEQPGSKYRSDGKRRDFDAAHRSTLIASAGWCR